MINVRFFLFCLIICLISDSMADEGVILLHGLCRSSGSMEKMEEKLIENGFKVKNLSYPSRNNDIKELSRIVFGEIQKDTEIIQCEKVHFVTHSLGGIIVRSILKDQKIMNLGNVVMLAPPNQGSEVVDNLRSCFLFQWLNGPAGSELGTDENSFLNGLGPPDFKLGIIAGDRSINWINSLMIKGVDDGKVSVERTKISGMSEHIVVHVSHPFIMKNEKVINYVISFLKTGTFNAN